jgi:hypothetical protein
MNKYLFLALMAIVSLSLAGAGCAKPAKEPAVSEIADPIQNEKIVVESPFPGALVKSPLTVTGKARGVWYFEASFPVELQDSNGKTMAQIPAMAQGDWMTEEFVPFTGTLEFAEPETFIGVLIFKKDNPSGLPEHDDQVRVPVKFK